MEQTGLPCSVIICHNEEVQNSELSAPVLMDDGLSYMTVTHQEDQFQENVEVNDEVTNPSLAAYQFVQLNMWPPASTTQNCVTAEKNTSLDSSENAEEINSNDISRISVRKKTAKRPYSPEVNAARKPLNKKRKNVVKPTKHTKNTRVDNDPAMTMPNMSEEKPFSCDKCGSSFVVDPTKSFRRKTKRRKYLPREILDPETNKLLVVCNACGLSMTRPKKVKPIKPITETKEQYLKNAVAFASTLATAVNDPDAAHLYCPAFKISSCKCLQKYITAKGSNQDGVEERITYLLSLIKEAKKLKQSYANEKSDSDAESQTKPKAGLQRRRTKLYEDFVLANRQQLRESINLCERACQRVLLYSNNFLHKKLKTSDGACRIERIHGKNALGLLPSISELAHEYCCIDRCIVLALTHPKLLQSWREQAAQGQREARKVLAEMLIPCGGAKGNCYKFISMVTGCSFATISLVNQHLRNTKGEREPPEHGMKKWWREHPKNKDEAEKTALEENAPSAPEANSEQIVIPETTPSIPEKDFIHSNDYKKRMFLTDNEANTTISLPIQEANELEMLNHAAVENDLSPLEEVVNAVNETGLPMPETNELHILNHATIEDGLSPAEKETVLPQQLEMLTWQQPVDEEPVQNVAVMMDNGDTVRRTDPQEFLHILELPTSSSTAVTNNAESATYEHPTVSLMTPNGELQTLTNITLNLSGTNVVILPHSAIDTSVITSNPVAEGTSVISYTSSAEQTSALPSCDDMDKNSPPTATLQLYGVVDPATNVLQLNY